MDASARARLNEAMARLADGDRDAFAVVFAALRPIVTSFARRYVGEPDADDAAQQALVRLFERAATYESGRDVVSWALAICAWECRTLRTRRGRRRESDLADAPAVATDTDPEVQTIARELEQAAEDVLGTLSPTDRETLRATFADERDNGVPSATFRKRRERAMTRLREAWRRIYGHE